MLQGANIPVVSKAVRRENRQRIFVEQAAAIEVGGDEAARLLGYTGGVEDWFETTTATFKDLDLDAPERPAWMDANAVVWDDDAIVARADELGRKFEATDMNDALIDYATEWVAVLPANESFDFLLDLRLKVVEGATLTAGQAKGVLNCLVPRVRREREAENKPLPVEPEPIAVKPEPKKGPAEDGIYVKDGVTYKVKRSVSSGYAYALALNTDTGKFDDLAKGMVFKLTEADRMSLEDAAAYGKLYGRCINCQRTLSNEESIERAMGPICAGRFA